MKKILSILLAAMLLGSMGVVGAFAATYTITFHEGENPLGITTTNLPPSMTKDVGIAKNLPTQIPLRTDFKFKGWAASPTLTTGQKVYAAGESYNSDETDTLYAIWEENICWVTINANTPPGGTVTGLPVPNPVKKFKDTLLSMSPISAAIACDGYTLAGWARNAAGPVTISITGSIGDQADVTLYAIWEADSYTVTLNGNAPSGCTVTGLPDPPTLTKIRNTSLQITETPVLGPASVPPAVSPAENYVGFLGWSTTPTGAVTIPPNGNYTSNAAATLYAVWKGRPITIKYNATTGSGAAMLDTAAEYGTAVTLRANTYGPPALGSFLGWATSEEDAAAGKVSYTDKQSVVFKPAHEPELVTEVELFAVWRLPDKTALKAQITQAGKLKEWKYTGETWAKLLKALDDAIDVRDNPTATQLQIDNARHTLALAERDLKSRNFIFSTVFEANVLNWVLFVLGFGWIWMWFVKK